MSMHKDVKIPLNCIYNGDKFLITDLRALFEYANGKPTQNQIGWRATLVDLQDYDKFFAKIMNLNPRLTPDILEANQDRIFVRLIDAFAKPYINNGRIAYSISAKDLEVVRKSATNAAERSHQNA